MKLTKRRSVPFLPTSHPFPLERAPSAISLIPAPVPPLPRIPFRRRGQSAGPELQHGADSVYSYDYDYDCGFGTEDAVIAEEQTRTIGGNVFISTSNDDCCRSLNPIHRMSSLSSTSFSTSIHSEPMGADLEGEAGSDMNGRKRDSRRQNRYPPNALEPGNGWGFGRMRRSRKQSTKVVAPLRTDSLLWKSGSVASGSETYLPEQPPFLNMAGPSTHARSPTSPTPPSDGFDPSNALDAYSHCVESPRSPIGPSAYARHLSFISDVGLEECASSPSPSPRRRPQSPSSTLTRSASFSDTVNSGESSWPLLNPPRLRRGSLSLPRFRRESSSATPRKLQKRRTGSASPSPYPPNIANPSDAIMESERKEDNGLSTSRTEQEGGDTDTCTDAQWVLARNSFTSTTASSMIAPSTEESTVLTPPYQVVGADGKSHHRWNSMEVPNISRSSTVSYSSGEDDLRQHGSGATAAERQTFDLKQMLLDDLVDAPPLPLLRPPLLQPHASDISTIIPDNPTPMVSPNLTTEPSVPESSSTASSPAVDFTASPIDRASLNTTSPAESPASTINASSPSPRNRRRANGHFRSRASSVSAMSINRASEYSITSIGEVGIASQGSMAAAVTVHLPALPQNLDMEDDDRPIVRPGMLRSKSEAGQHLSRALTPFLSREPLKTSPRLSPRLSLASMRPKPATRLSLPLLDTKSVQVENEDKVQLEALSPSRTTSLGRLWRRLSSGRRKTKSSSSNSSTRMGDTGPLKSVSCVDVSTRVTNELVDSPTTTFRLPYDVPIPEVPTPAPRSSSLVGLHLRPPTSTVSFASSAWSTTSVDDTGRKPIGPRKSSLSTPPSFTISDYSHDSYFPNGFTGSHLPRAAEAPSTRMIIEGVTLANTPDVIDNPTERADEGTGQSPPRVARRRPDHRRPRFSMDDSTPSDPTVEERRKYRQTLVDIQDDVVFHQVLQDLARLERQGQEDEEVLISNGEVKPVKEEWKASKGEIRAWFVTRELVQGERRHGRLLARGVATVQAAAESRRDEVPPLPTHASNPHPSPSVTSLQNVPSKTSFLSRRAANSRSTTSVPLPRQSPPSSSIHLSPLSINISPRLRTRALPSAPPSPTTSPLELLLERLPRLLALSLTLSSRFEDDPSPYGVAEAFVKMEDDLVKEIGLWAGEVGNIVAVGMGEMLDTSMSSMARGRSRRSISGDAVTDDESQQEDRLGFADIIIMPIQRAARYRLLFQEMLTITDTSTQSYVTVNEALLSAERLAAECDRRQVFDLQAIRRPSHASAGSGKKGKIRPRSVGVQGVGNGHPKEKSWAAGLRAVEI